MRIGELSERLGLNPRTIRFYETTGILPEPPRTPSGYRDYDESDVERVRFIRLAQSLGFSLDEIAEVLAFRDRGDAPCGYVRAVLHEKAAAIEQQIHELERLRIELQRLARRAGRLPRSGGRGEVCHILENEQAPEKVGRN